MATWTLAARRRPDHVPVHRLRPPLRPPARRAVPRPARRATSPARCRDDEFRALRLQNGWYVQRHAPMLRVAVPYGELSSRQLRALARIAREHDRGYGHFTTRQNLQFNWIPLTRSADVMDALAEVDMHGIQTSGNCIRNITSDALAGIARRRDRRPAALLRDPAPVEHAAPGVRLPAAQVQDRRDRRRRGPRRDRLARHRPAPASRTPPARSASRCWWAAAWAARRSSARVIREFLPWQQILVFIEAIVRVYNRYGRRDNMYKARIKILVKAEGQKLHRRGGRRVPRTS